MIQADIITALYLTLCLGRSCLRYFHQEILANYEPTRSSWSTTPTVESQTREHPSDETPRMTDVLPFQGMNRRPPEQVIGAHFPSMAREEPSFRYRARIRSSLFKEDKTSTESGNFTSHRTRPSPKARRSSPKSHLISPVPSLFRARARALTITGASGLSRLGGTDDDMNQGVHSNGCPNGDGRRDFWSYESPFSRRVKEKLREAHVPKSEASRGPSNQAVDLLASDEDAGRYCSPEISGADLISFHVNIVENDSHF